MWTPRFYPPVTAAREIPPVGLVSVVSDYLEVGYFADWPRPSTATASALASTWKAVQGEDLPTSPFALDEALVELDFTRSIGFSVYSDDDPSDERYTSILTGLSWISRGGFRVQSIREELVEEAENHRQILALSADTNVGRFSWRLSLLGYVHTVVLTDVLAALPVHDERIYFYPSGPSRALITRASPLQRAFLRDSRNVELSHSPPGWWLESLDRTPSHEGFPGLWHSESDENVPDD